MVSLYILINPITCNKSKRNIKSIEYLPKISLAIYIHQDMIIISLPVEIVTVHCNIYFCEIVLYYFHIREPDINIDTLYNSNDSYASQGKYFYNYLGNVMLV